MMGGAAHTTQCQRARARWLKIRRRVLQVGTVTIRPSLKVRYLGIILDKELRWHDQVDNAVAKGTAATLAIGRLASGRFGLPYKYVRTLYISVVKPKLEYGIVVWYTPVQEVPGATRRRGSAGFATRLERVQRIATRLITGAFKTAPTDALEYRADLMPMDLQLNLAAFNAALRLATLPPDHPLFPAVQKSRDGGPRYFKSPLHKVFRAFPQLLEVETIDPTPRATTWSPSLSTLIEPTRASAIAAVEKLEQSDTFVVYSDGSGEDGQVGAAAVAAHPRGGVITARAHLGALDEHTVFEAELFGILLALRIVLDIPSVADVEVCLDNTSAIVRTHNPTPKSGQVITAAIHRALAQLRKRCPGFRLRLVWVPGHEGVDGNELADLHAKRAAAADESPLATINGECLPCQRRGATRVDAPGLPTAVAGALGQLAARVREVRQCTSVGPHPAHVP